MIAPVTDVVTTLFKHLGEMFGSSGSDESSQTVDVRDPNVELTADGKLKPLPEQVDASNGGGKPRGSQLGSPTDPYSQIFAVSDVFVAKAIGSL